MSNKRKRERRRAIAGQRVKAIVAETRIGLPDRKVATRRALPGITPGRQVVTASQVVDVKPLPRRVSAPLSLKAPAVTSRPSTVKSVRVPSPTLSPRAVSVIRKPALPKPAARPAVSLSLPVQPSQPASTPSRTPLPTCKQRPSSSISKGGGSRSYVPWCR